MDLDVPKPGDPLSPADQPPVLTEDTACVQSSLEATAATRPMDIIFVVDNHSSMREEIREVERQISQNFWPVLEQSGIDYRVLLVSAYGPPVQTPTQPAQITAPFVSPRLLGADQMEMATDVAIHSQTSCQ